MCSALQTGSAKSPTTLSKQRLNQINGDGCKRNYFENENGYVQARWPRFHCAACFANFRLLPAHPAQKCTQRFRNNYRRLRGCRVKVNIFRFTVPILSIYFGEWFLLLWHKRIFSPLHCSRLFAVFHSQFVLFHFDIYKMVRLHYVCMIEAMVCMECGQADCLWTA